MPDKVAKTPKPPKAKKKLKRFFLFAAVAFFLALLSFPIWSVWIARPLLLLSSDVRVGSIRAISWDQWEADSLSYQTPGISAEAHSIVLPSPSALVLQHLNFDSQKRSIQIDDWQLTTSSKDTESSTGQAPSLSEIQAIVTQITEQLERYFSLITLNQGSIRIGESNTIDFQKISYQEKQLSVQLKHKQTRTEGELTLDLRNPDAWLSSVASPSLGVSADFAIKPTDAEVEVLGEFVYFENRVEFHSTWPSEATSGLPREASLKAKDIQLDDRYSFWKGVPELTADASLNWDGSSYRFDVLGREKDTLSTPPAIKLSGQGSLDTVQIDSAQIELPWFKMQNDQAIVFDLKKGQPLSNAQLFATIDLGEIPFIEASGSLGTEITTQYDEDEQSSLAVNLKGSSITFFDTVLDQINARIRATPQVIQISQFSASSTQGSTLKLSGDYQIQEQSIENLKLTAALENESPKLRNLIGSIEWERMTCELEANGPVLSPTLEGQLSLGKLDLPKLKPLELSANFSGSFDSVDARLSAIADTQEILLELNATKTNQQSTVTVAGFTLLDAEKNALLEIETPFEIVSTIEDSSISVTDVVLHGTSAQLSIDRFHYSNQQLALQASILDFDPSLFDSWLESPLPPIKIADFSADLAFDQTSSKLYTTGSTSWSIDEANAVEIAWLAKADSSAYDGLTIENLEIGANDKHILIAEGSFPVSIDWINGQPVTRVMEDAPLSFVLNSSPHPDFWRSVQEHLPFAVIRPVISADLSGTLERPRGTFNLKLQSLTWNAPADGGEPLQLEDIEASMLADAHELTIQSLKASSGSNHIEAQATLPLGEVSLYDIALQKAPLDLRRLTGQATISITELARLGSFKPTVLRNDGSASIEVEMKPGDLQATATVSGISTRPLPPLGSLSEISGTLRLENKVWTTEKITGLAEKSPFTLSGSADLTELSSPKLDLNFKSQDFPMVRDSGLLLSGDLDVSLVSRNQSRPLIRGSILLNKGLVLVEPDLLASQTKTVSSRPPYFSVEQAPFREWGLDLDIKGNDFLRVSNSFFEGTLSAEFDLEGTLGSPLLIGRAEASSGRIFFPASSLKLKRGQALITRDRPSELQLEAVAEGRLFAYDVNLKAGGPVDDLDLAITTNPAMTQVEALLLLTTGTTPDNQGELAQNSATSLGIFLGKGLFRKLTGSSGDAASRLQLEVGKDISLQAKKTVEASYELSEELEIEGEYDKRDEFNANLKWTIFKK